jgi:hypothetical protein
MATSGPSLEAPASKWRSSPLRGHISSLVLTSDVDRVLLQLKLRDQEIEIIMLKQKLEEQIKINAEMVIKIQKLQETVLDYQEDCERQFYNFSPNQHR